MYFCCSMYFLCCLYVFCVLFYVFCVVLYIFCVVSMYFLCCSMHFCCSMYFWYCSMYFLCCSMYFLLFYVFFVLFYVFFVLFSVLFVSKCVLCNVYLTDISYTKYLASLTIQLPIYSLFSYRPVLIGWGLFATPWPTELLFKIDIVRNLTIGTDGNILFIYKLLGKTKCF